MEKIKSVEQFTSAIPQEHPMGCAVACVAYRCKMTYWEALDLFSVKEFAWTRGYYCSEIVEALGRVNLQYMYGKFNFSLHEEFVKNSGTIVFVGPCKEYPGGHFFIQTQNGWMNPWDTFPRISEVKASFQKVLPGKIQYIVYEI